MRVPTVLHGLTVMTLAGLMKRIVGLYCAIGNSFYGLLVFYEKEIVGRRWENLASEEEIP